MRDAQSERDARMRVRGGRMFLVSPCFGRKSVKERRRKGKERKRKGRKNGKKERRKGKKRREGVVAGDGRRSPAAAGVGRSWPEKAAKAPSPRLEWECKSSEKWKIGVLKMVVRRATSRSVGKRMTRRRRWCV